jgi:hypothetical protein
MKNGSNKQEIIVKLASLISNLFWPPLPIYNSLPFVVDSEIANNRNNNSNTYYLISSILNLRSLSPFFSPHPGPLVILEWGKEKFLK